MKLFFILTILRLVLGSQLEASTLRTIPREKCRALLSKFSRVGFRIDSYHRAFHQADIEERVQRTPRFRNWCSTRLCSPTSLFNALSSIQKLWELPKVRVSIEALMLENFHVLANCSKTGVPDSIFAIALVNFFDSLGIENNRYRVDHLNALVPPPEKVFQKISDYDPSNQIIFIDDVQIVTDRQKKVRSIFGAHKNLLVGVNSSNDSTEILILDPKFRGSNPYYRGRISKMKILNGSDGDFLLRIDWDRSLPVIGRKPTFVRSLQVIDRK